MRNSRAGINNEEAWRNVRCCVVDIYFWRDCADMVYRAYTHFSDYWIRELEYGFCWGRIDDFMASTPKSRQLSRNHFFRNQHIQIIVECTLRLLQNVNDLVENQVWLEYLIITFSFMIMFFSLSSETDLFNSKRLAKCCL